MSAHTPEWVQRVVAVERGFTHVDGTDTQIPWVKIDFPLGDWKRRDGCAAWINSANEMPAVSHVKLIPILQLFDEHGNQVCDTGYETCHFYVSAQLPNYGPACNHCQRGIPDNKPHRLCPVLQSASKATGGTA